MTYDAVDELRWRAGRPLERTAGLAEQLVQRLALGGGDLAYL